MNISGGGSVPLLPFRTVIRYVATGVVGWFLAGVAFLWALPNLAAGEFRSTQTLVLVHLLVLGWATMLAQGAIYQLIPVAFQVGIHNRRLAKWNYWFYLFGTAGLVGSFTNYWIPGLRFFGGIVALAVVFFVSAILRSLRQVKVRGAIYGFVLSSIIYLGITVLMGFSMLVMISLGMWAEYLAGVYTTHIWFGLIGWFTLLIIGFSYKLFPMFTLAHGFAEHRQKWILTFFHSAIIFSVLGAFLRLGGLSGIGAGLLLAGSLVYGWDILDIYKHRMKGKLETPMVMAVTAIAWLAFLASVVLISNLLGVRISDGWITGMGLVYFLGWLSQTIVGYLYKIAPFLIWNERYSHKVGKEPVPLLKDMVDERFTKWVLLSFNAGIVTALLGTGLGMTVVVYAGIVLVTAAVVMFAYQMAKVILPPAKDKGGV